MVEDTGEEDSEEPDLISGFCDEVSDEEVLAEEEFPLKETVVLVVETKLSVLLTEDVETLLTNENG